MTAPDLRDQMAMAALTKCEEHFEFLARLSSGGPVYEVVKGKRVRVRLADAVRNEAKAGADYVRAMLAQRARTTEGE